DPRQCAAVKGVHGSDDFKTPFVVTELARELEQTLVCLGPTVAEKAFAGANEVHERLREPALWFVIIKIGGVDELARLFEQSFRDRRVGMAQAAYCDTAAQIQIAFPGDIIDITARSAAKHNFEPAITRNHVFLEQA